MPRCPTPARAPARLGLQPHPRGSRRRSSFAPWCRCPAPARMQHAYNAVTGAGMRVPLISGGGSGNYFTFAGGARVPGTTGAPTPVARTHAPVSVDPLAKWPALPDFRASPGRFSRDTRRQRHGHGDPGWRRAVVLRGAWRCHSPCTPPHQKCILVSIDKRPSRIENKRFTKETMQYSGKRYGWSRFDRPRKSCCVCFYEHVPVAMHCTRRSRSERARPPPRAPARPRQAYDDSHSVAWPEAWRKHRNSLFLMCRAGFIVCSAGQRKHAVILV